MVSTQLPPKPAYADLLSLSANRNIGLVEVHYYTTVYCQGGWQYNLL